MNKINTYPMQNNKKRDELLNKLKDLQEKKNTLEKRNINLVVADFDDTIFSTHEVIEKDYRKWKRWAEWNDFIIENNLIEVIIEECYKNKIYPQTIVSQLKQWVDLILTAWMDDFQKLKLEATKLKNINCIVTPTAEDKIFALINYILKTIKIIPETITIYEDRPKFFIEYRDIIEKFLWTKLEIRLVKMNWNSKEPEITVI